ncbi:hypothetical protein [Vibrio pacinii]|nr:hypothetical protein [Vibrio pacinii]
MTTYNVDCDESRHTSDTTQHNIVGRLHGLMTKHGYSITRIFSFIHF